MINELIIILKIIAVICVIIALTKTVKTLRLKDVNDRFHNQINATYWVLAGFAIGILIKYLK